ncbi:hypothetical protein [Lichenifustis flavocetrariae]|uniref:Uncharacterized protein n=1 Tax=Lichenifustis flavocetrariae TaxID=2949735 RepID=A0AA41YYS8_9HYPH|nr:hypothetical protein [Lichenifustis flavocetrariae]MCW6510599.1 hypothetical protein [Lichenifustis flavocetrariae]
MTRSNVASSTWPDFMARLAQSAPQGIGRFRDVGGYLVPITGESAVTSTRLFLT